MRLAAVSYGVPWYSFPCGVKGIHNGQEDESTDDVSRDYSVPGRIGVHALQSVHGR